MPQLTCLNNQKTTASIFQWFSQVKAREQGNSVNADTKISFLGHRVRERGGE
jgi:hypothetical protein